MAYRRDYRKTHLETVGVGPAKIVWQFIMVMSAESAWLHHDLKFDKLNLSEIHYTRWPMNSIVRKLVRLITVAESAFGELNSIEIYFGKVHTLAFYKGCKGYKNIYSNICYGS